MKKKEQIALLEATLARDPGNKEIKDILKGLNKHKYGAQKTEIDGHMFDSKREAHYYQELKLRQRAGEITGISLQPEFVLQEAFTKNGKKHRAIKYLADFQITYPDGRIEIIDVKGFKTREFRNKQKMFEKRYPDLSIVVI